MSKIPVLERLATALAEKREQTGECIAQGEGVNIKSKPQKYCHHDLIECPYKGKDTAFLGKNHNGNVDIFHFYSCSYVPKDKQPQ